MSRRRLSTLRPEVVVMRRRKPCVFSRLRTFGCQVRFVAILLRSRFSQTVTSVQPVNSPGMCRARPADCLFIRHDRRSHRIGQPQTAGGKWHSGNNPRRRHGEVRSPHCPHHACLSVKMALYVPVFQPVKFAGAFPRLNTAPPPPSVTLRGKSSALRGTWVVVLSCLKIHIRLASRPDAWYYLNDRVNTA